jgi:hypothetical protein
MFDKILIANRGEIALRIQRACRELGIKTVVVHSEADTEAKYVKLADESVCIGPAPSRDSYLNIPAIISAAEVTDAEAIHPATASCPRTPTSPSASRRAASSSSARARRLDPPDGRQGQRQGRDEGGRRALRAGLRRRAAGRPEGDRAIAREGRLPGHHQGGRRRRRARHARGAHRGRAAQRRDDDPHRGGAAFGNPTVYMEKFLENPRHIEIQVLADEHRNAVYLGERDCSMQRRHQKIIEEAPAPGIAARLIARIGERCADACKQDRLPRRRHLRVPVRERRVLLHRDEHARAGRASGDRDDHRHRHRAGADPHRRGEKLRSASATSSSGATRSSAASTPRTPFKFTPSPGASPPGTRRADPASASIRTCTRTTSCRRTTTR